MSKTLQNCQKTNLKPPLLNIESTYKNILEIRDWWNTPLFYEKYWESAYGARQQIISTNLRSSQNIPFQKLFTNLQCPCHFLPPGTRGTKWTEGKTEPRLFSDLAEASLAPTKWSLALFAPFRVPYNLSKLRFKKFGSFRTPQVGPFRRGIRFISHPKFQGG